MTVEPKVDLVFRLAGDLVPQDHAYPLYGAIARLLGDLHQSSELAIFPLLGTPRPDGFLRLSEKRGRLRVRAPLSQVPRMLELAGRSLEIAGRSVHVGTSQISPIRPHDRLASRLVVIKGYLEPDPFLLGLKKQLAELELAGAEPKLGRRRVVRIRDDVVVGFATELSNLSEIDSIRIQSLGLGGRHKFGCGNFLPVGRMGMT